MARDSTSPSPAAAAHDAPRRSHHHHSIRRPRDDDDDDDNSDGNDRRRRTYSRSPSRSKLRSRSSPPRRRRRESPRSHSPRRREHGRQRERSRSRDRDRERERRDRHERDRHHRHDRSDHDRHHRHDRDDHDRHYRRDRDDHRRRHRTRTRSPTPPPRSPRSRRPLPSQDDSFRGDGPHSGEVGRPAAPPKEKPNYKPSGALAAAANTVSVRTGPQTAARSVVLKYHEPDEARKPPARDAWTLFAFDGGDSKGDAAATVPLGGRSCWLFGSETGVADVLDEGKEVDRQHAVLQFRHVTARNAFGERVGRVALYLLDLESGKGTVLNGERVEPARYVECRSGDVFRLGGAAGREYVLLLPGSEKS